MKRFWMVVTAIVVALFGVALGVTAARLYARIASYAGVSFSLDSAEDRWEVRRFAYLALPAIHALEESRSKSGAYPMKIAEVEIANWPEYLSDMFYPLPAPASSSKYFPRFAYTPQDDRQSYILNMEFNLDEALFYYSADNQWVYREDDAEWVIGEDMPHGQDRRE